MYAVFASSDTCRNKGAKQACASEMTRDFTYLDLRSKSVEERLTLGAFEPDHGSGLRDVSKVQKQKLCAHVLESETAN
jgi:hypothetical protein